MKKVTLMLLILLISSFIRAGEHEHSSTLPEPFIGPLVQANDLATYSSMRYDPKIRKLMERNPLEARYDTFDYGECPINRNDDSPEITESSSIWEKLSKKKISIGLISLGGDFIYRYILKRPFEALIKKIMPLTDKEIMNHEESSARKNAALGSRIAFDVAWFGGAWGIAAACGLV